MLLWPVLPIHPANTAGGMPRIYLIAYTHRDRAGAQLPLPQNRHHPACLCHGLCTPLVVNRVPVSYP